MPLRDVCSLPRSPRDRPGTGLEAAYHRDDKQKCAGGIMMPLTSGDIGLLTGPHQMLFLELSSSTTRLSEGERPVLAPEYAERAPVDVMAEPVS